MLNNYCIKQADIESRSTGYWLEEVMSRGLCIDLEPRYGEHSSAIFGRSSTEPMDEKSEIIKVFTTIPGSEGLLQSPHQKEDALQTNGQIHYWCALVGVAPTMLISFTQEGDIFPRKSFTPGNLMGNPPNSNTQRTKRSNFALTIDNVRTIWRRHPWSWVTESKQSRPERDPRSQEMYVKKPNFQGPLEAAYVQCGRSALCIPTIVLQAYQENCGKHALSRPSSIPYSGSQQSRTPGWIEKYP